ncbi:MAG: helicase [Opitutae bacterium]|nr:helicase [Opitutae bacterium]
MHFSLEQRTASLSVGEFANFALGPREAGGGPQGLWRAQLGQHWHNELRLRTEKESSVGGALRPDVQFEVPIDGRLTHRGWTFHLHGRIDQLVGDTLREIKSVTRPLPAEEAGLRADYPPYFLQLAAYAVLRRALGAKGAKAELIFVEAGTGLAQTIPLTPFDEALVHHQLDALVEFLNLRQRATARRRSLTFRHAFESLRPGQETIQQDLQAAVGGSQISDFKSQILLFEAPTGYGKTGCVLEFALGRMRAGRFARLIWLTGKSTGQIQVVRTLEQMTGGAGPPDRLSPEKSTRPEAGFHPLSPDTCHIIDDKLSGGLAFWQVRNKAEHCVNHTFHCVRDGCDYLRDCAERWPGSGLAKFYLDDAQPHDLDTLRRAGRDARICPYEITRTALAFKDVWIGDYNYVFAPDNRGLFYEQPGFDPAETLLVIDEAHNLPSRTADAHSHHANDGDARLLLAELDHLRAPAPLILAVGEWARLLASLQPADSLDPVQEAEVHDSVVKLANLVAAQPLDYATLGPRHSESLWLFAALAEFLDDTKLTKLLWVPRAGELNFTCIDAAPAIGEILREYGGAILMSATLQPYAELAAACGLEVVGRGVPSAPSPGGQGTARPTGYAILHAPTPWRAGAYDVAVDLRVDTSYRQRANHYGTTAATIEALHAAASSQVSGFRSQVSATRCIAVFFPSYAYADSVQRALDNSDASLRVTLQPRGTDLATQSAWVEENLALADVLFLVLGSSFAEGIDLLGGRVTHAMVVGPALPEVNAIQKARLDACSDLGRDAAFRRVYQIPGLQKVNQALGRLVRAPGQHAKVLLHCRRFTEPSYASLLAADYQFYREIASEADLRGWLATKAY